MNSRFSEPRTDLAADIKTVAGAFRMLFLLALGVVVLFLIFRWDASCEHPFVEEGPTEIFQSLLLLACTSLLFIEARRNESMRGAMLLAGGFFGCMLIREQDYYLDMISHGCWKWPAIALTLCCTAAAARTPRATLAGLAVFVRKRYFPMLLTGVVIVLVYSRLFGMGSLWNMLLPDVDGRAAKNAIEESSELLGYLLIFASTLLMRSGKS